MRNWWRKWSYEIPLAISDALWEVLVVQLAAVLDRLTVRQVIAFIPVVILIVAYYHKIPIPPELMLIGDLLAYLDIFSVLFLLGVLSRIATVLFVTRQATLRAVALVRILRAGLQRLDVRHRRERGTTMRPHRKPDRSDDDGAYGGAWGQAWGNGALA